MCESVCGHQDTEDFYQLKETGTKDKEVCECEAGQKGETER